MVYCGRPSKACESCRARRIKCDFRRPSCTQCTKIFKVCPGYRDQLDLAFRDESAAVVRRVQGRKKKAASPPAEPKMSGSQSANPAAEPSQDIDTADGSDEELLLLPLHSTPSFAMEDFATVHFMTTYITGSHFDYLPAVYAASSPGSPLFAAVNANAFANLYRESGDPEMLVKSRSHYVEALRQTNHAISSHSQAKLDSTISSILLLGLYETFTHGRQASTKSFIAHNNGAAALLRLRGQEQFNTLLGQRICWQVSLNMRVSCSDRNVKLPADLLAVDEMSAKKPMEVLFMQRLRDLTDELNEIRMAGLAEIRNNAVTTSSIEKALVLEQKLAVVMERFTERFKLDTVKLDHDDPNVLGRSYRTFPGHRVAQGYNVINMMRLVCHNHVWEYMERIAGGDLTDSTMRTDKSSYLLQMVAKRTGEELARNICASVPQFCKREANGMVPATVAMFLMWPLALAGHSRHSPPEVKAYCIDRLKYLGKEARLPQGLWAAQILEENGPIGEWLHLTHIA